MMDEESWMSAQKAVNEGFATGILYTETESEPAMNAFSLSRMAIANSSDNVMTRFFEQWQKVQAGKGQPTPATKEETPANNRISNIQMRVSVREKMNRRHNL
jgi:ATP-dependent Clp protease protease subunit